MKVKKYQNPGGNMPQNPYAFQWNPVTKKVEYVPTTPNYVAETFAAQQRQRQVQNGLQ